MNILHLLILIPLLTVAGILNVKSMKSVRWVSATGMFLQLILAVVVMLTYMGIRKSGDTSEMVLMADYAWFSSFNIHYTIGVDGISCAMILLTSIVMFAGVFASWELEYLQKEFFVALILLVTGVYGFFISLDLFTMFLYYEIAVIPMYLLIGIWGTGPKEYSAMKLTLMLMGGSALLIVALFGIYYSAGDSFHSFNLLELAKHPMSESSQRFFFPFAFIGFGVLGALFPFHTWSPDGHASAPTAVSMLHAGVLMKLGGYGIFRVAMYLMPQAAQEQAWIFIILTSISVIYGAFGAIWQKDLKYINAYSSVSHCGLVIFGLLMLNQTALDGAILQMISHGLMTALFFALIGMIYSRTHTRQIHEMGGLMKVIPFLAVVYMIAGFASLGLPGLSGFAAEMTIFVGAFQHADIFHRVATIMAISAIVVTAVYILRVVGILLLGPIKNDHYLHLKDATWYEKLSTLTLLAAVAGVGLYPEWLYKLIFDSLAPVAEKLAAM
ncbi:MAG: NADH-quinone oxidoreductase subunit M [Breznakibacter sp.]